ADLSSAGADRSIAGTERSRAMDHSVAGADHSIAGTERRTPGMVRREGSRVSRRHVLVSPTSPPQRSSLRQSEAFSTSLLLFGAECTLSGTLCHLAALRR